MAERTNLTMPRLSRVGLGAWVFGGVGWGPQEDADSLATIATAVAQGVDWIDTAAVYGGGHAERIGGTALEELPAGERPLVFTKGGIRIDADGATYRDLSPASLREECEQSLARLGIERIDLYQLHWPVEDTETVEAAWTTLGDLRREGKIRWAGVSNFDLKLLERCHQIEPLDAAQMPLSLLERRILAAELPWLAERGVSTIVYSPLESGLLSGSFSAERLASLPEDDWRRRRPRFQSPGVDRTLDLVERLRPIAAGLESSVAELAIAWAAHHEGVAGAIVGARSPAQVDGWIGAAMLALDAQALGEIDFALAEAGLDDA